MAAMQGVPHVINLI